MAAISINVKDAKKAEIEEAVASLYGYQATLEDGTPNPESKADFVKTCLKRYLQNTLIEYRNRKALSNVNQDSEI